MNELKSLLIQLDQVNKDIERLRRGELNADEMKKAEQIGKNINTEKIHKGIAEILKEV